MKRLLLVLSLVILNGCYTQLAMFHTPKPETEEREWDYDSYSSYSLGTYYSDQLFYSYYGYGSPFGYRNIYSNMYGWNYYTSPYYRSYNPYYYINEKSIKNTNTVSNKRTWTRENTSTNSNLVIRRSSNTSSTSSTNTGRSTSSNSSNSRVTRRNN